MRKRPEAMKRENAKDEVLISLKTAFVSRRFTFGFKQSAGVLSAPARGQSADKQRTQFVRLSVSLGV